MITLLPDRVQTSTPHLSTSESDAAANRRADSICEWHRAHTNPIASHYSHKNPSASSSSNSHLPSNTSDTKDPAVPHPDDDHLRAQPLTHTPPPAEQRTLTSVTSFGGYHSAPPAPPRRPTLTSIFKSHRDAPFSALNRLSATCNKNQHTLNSADTSLCCHQPFRPTPTPSRHQFQSILPYRPNAVSRPYISAPRSYNVDGTPWCEACTAQLSDDDLNTPGLRDPDLPDIRYRLRMDHNQPPTHSNSQLDLTRIHRTNAEYHRQQRESTESQQVRTGILPSLQTHTSYVNIPDAPDIAATMARFQYQRLNRGTHHLDYSYNSPNTTNMTPGKPYRHWFHRTISRSYYSLGEAATQYDQWLNDPEFGPSPTK